jgi:hypothetical protein
MILRLACGLGLRGTWRPAAAALALIVVLASAPAARGQADDLYSDTVRVDATAATVVKARDKARLDGQRRALTAIVDRLAGGPGKVKLPKLDDNAITDMVANFEVADERMSPVRYIADYTFHFRPAEVKRLLQGAGVNLADTGGAAAEAGPPGILLPVYQVGGKAVLWDDPNPWREAWADRKPGSGAPRFTVPLGDVSDVTEIDADKAVAGNADALTAYEKKNGTDSAFVAVAALRAAAGGPEGLDIAVRHYRGGKLGEIHTLQVNANPGEDEAALLRRAVAATEAAIDSGWKGAPGQYDQPASLTVAAPITTLDDWVRLRDQLNSVPAIRKIELRSLSRQEVVIDISYIGSTEQLTAGIAALGLQLSPGDPLWHLANSGTGPQQ